MPALRTLLTPHASLLWIDTSSQRVHVGLLRQGHPDRWAVRAEEAGTGLFTATEEVLQPTGVTLEQIDAFVFCSAPGSVLGIRTAAVALRTWCALRPRSVFSYNGLALVAAHLHTLGRPGPLTLIADARRDSWHALTLEAGGQLSPLTRVATAALPAPLALVEDFRHWSTPPAGAERLPYLVPEYVATAAEVALLQPAEAPDAFLHEEPVYQTWTPHVHRPPV
jgi:tRNA threonylcarbamoyladenosine biosynthesis protein TsaB